MPIMKTIVEFRKKEDYGNHYDYAKVVYLKEEDNYALIYKYTSMKKEVIYIYNDQKLAMYDFNRRIMFILS